MFDFRTYTDFYRISSIVVLLPSVDNKDIISIYIIIDINGGKILFFLAVCLIPTKSGFHNFAFLFLIFDFQLRRVRCFAPKGLYSAQRKFVMISWKIG